MAEESIIIAEFRQETFSAYADEVFEGLILEQERVLGILRLLMNVADQLPTQMYKRIDRETHALLGQTSYAPHWDDVAPERRGRLVTLEIIGGRPKICHQRHVDAMQ